MSIGPFVRPFIIHPSVHLYIQLSILLCICPSSCSSTNHSFIHLSNYPMFQPSSHLYLSIVHPSTHLSIFPWISPSFHQYPAIHWLIHPSSNMPNLPWIFHPLFICLPTTGPSIQHPTIHPSGHTCLSACCPNTPSFHLFIHTSTHPPIHLSIHLSVLPCNWLSISAPTIHPSNHPSWNTSNRSCSHNSKCYLHLKKKKEKATQQAEAKLDECQSGTLCICSLWRVLVRLIASFMKTQDEN